MFKLCLTVILLGLTQINCENLPAIIWGSKTLSPLPALTRLSGEEFVTLVKSQANPETLTVVFVERKLSVENLSQCKLKTETCFQNLRKVDKTYVPAVEDPVSALQESFSDNNQRTISLSNEGDVERFDASGNEKLLFVYFDTVQSDEDFAQHDELMSKLFNSIASKRENVIAVYTARHPSFVYSAPVIRKTRDTENAVKQEGGEPTEKKQRVIVDKNFLFALSSMSIDGNDVAVDKITISTNDSTDKFSLDVHVIEGDNDILFKFQLSGGTWWIPEISYKNSFFQPHSQVSAYDGDSYGCVDLRLTNARIHIVIEDVQMQPRFDTAEPELTKFADKYNDCVGFFSAAIWGGIFVVFILLSILSCGITMMLDIKTMDRFDDPKGKTITINAQE